MDLGLAGISIEVTCQIRWLAACSTVQLRNETQCYSPILYKVLAFGGFAMTTKEQLASYTTKRTWQWQFLMSQLNPCLFSRVLTDWVK